jgi:putative endopeptidase
VRTTNHRLQTTLDSLSKSTNPPGSIEQKVGDMYASGMDSAAIDRRGIEPVKPFLQQIDSIRNTRDIMRYVAAEQRRNDNLLFSLSVGSDDRNSRMNIAGFSQGGLGLPDRDYYFKKDSPTLAVVAAYKEYIRNLFVPAGDDSATASQKAEKVYGLERELAASHRTSVELRDPISNYHKMTVAALDGSMPSFAWKNTLEAMGIHVDSLIVRQPGFSIQGWTSC